MADYGGRPIEDLTAQQVFSPQRLANAYAQSAKNAPVREGHTHGLLINKFGLRLLPGSRGIRKAISDYRWRNDGQFFFCSELVERAKDDFMDMDWRGVKSQEHLRNIGCNVAKFLLRPFAENIAVWMMTRLKLWVIGENLNPAGRAEKGAVLSSQSALVAGEPILVQGQRWSTSRRLLF